MKNSRHILSMSILAAFLLSSCDTQRITPEEPVETVTPVLVSDTDGDISFPAAGGQGTIGYGIENPVENENISVSIHEGGEWIRNIDSSAPGVISYEVLANEGAERQTVLILSYAEAQPLAFNIRQNAAGSDPQFVFNEDSVREYADGGEIELRYNILNPVGNGEVTAQLTEGTDWVSGIDTGTKNLLKFTIAENTTGSERQTTIRLKHDMASFELAIIQSGEYKPRLQFVLETVEITATSITWDCIPSIKDQTYITMVVEKSYWDEFSSAEEYILDDIEYFRQVAEASGMTLEEFLSQHQLQKGDLRGLHVDGQTPATEYVIYAYGLTASAEITSDIEYLAYATEEQSDFEISYSSYDGTEVNMHVIPADAQRWYWFDFVSDEGLDEEEFAEAAQAKLNDLIDSYSWLFSIEECVMMYCSQGEDNKYYDIDGPGEYIGYAVYVDETTGLFNSALTTVPYSSGGMSGASTRETVLSKAY